MNETEYRQVLEKAKALVASGWTQGASARDQSGHPCLPLSAFVHTWCFLGACENALFVNGHDEDAWLDLIAVLKRAISASGEISPIVWNDALEREQPEVLALFDKTIESLASNESPQ